MSDNTVSNGSGVDARQPGIATGLSLLIPITLAVMAVTLLAPILPRLLEEFSHVPNHEFLVPMVLTVPALCVALLSPLAGMLGDYFGRRKLLLLSFVFYAAFGVAPVFLGDLRLILLSRIGVGAAEALIVVLSTTMIGDYYSGSAREKWLAGQTACASLSAILFFGLGGFLGNFGWRTPFWVYGSALLMMLAVVLFTWEPDKSGAPRKAEDAPRNVSWAGFPWMKMALIAATTVYASVLFYAVQIQASSGLAALGLTDSGRIGLMTAVASLGVPIGTYVYARLAPGSRVVKLLLAELLLLAAGFMMMSLADTPRFFVVGCFVTQLGSGMLLPTLLVWALSLLSFDIRSRGTGLWQSAFMLGQFVSPIVVTMISLRVGGLLPSFAYLAYASVFGAVIVVVAMLRAPQPGTQA